MINKSFKSKNFFTKVVWLLTTVFFGQLCAYSFEFRSPVLLEHGPLRSLTEEESSGYGARYWSAFYRRDAQKAFSSKHSTTTQDIASLFFGKSEFRASEMFKDCFVDQGARNFNPLLRTARLHMSARYSELGAIFGISWDMPVYDNSTRIGFRFSVPVKKIKVTKVDMQGIRQGAELQDILAIRVNEQADFNFDTGVLDPNKVTLQDRIIAVRMDFAEALRQSSGNNSALSFETNRTQIGSVNVHFSDIFSGNDQGEGAADYKAVAGLDRNQNPVTSNAADLNARKCTQSRGVAIVSSPEGLVPSRTSVTTDLITSSTKKTIDDLKSLKEGEFMVFGAAGGFKELKEDANASIEKRKTYQDLKASRWLVPIFVDNIDPVTNAVGVAGGSASTQKGQSRSVRENGVLSNLNYLSEQVTENVYEWFADRQGDGKDNRAIFETFTKEGVGDCDLEMFFSHSVSDLFAFEAFAGFKAPTGGRVKFNTNPYYIPLGNGGHWEAKFGGLASFSATSIFTVKLDGYYSHVFGHNEERPAVFKGALVKLGPKTDADVKWDYFVGNVDLNMSHFSTKDITGMIGYQFYYKRKDKIKYKESKIMDWLGTADIELDADHAQENTNSISHRMRCEGSFIINDWLEFYAGGAWSFAGRNSLRSVDGHLGFNVAF